MFLLLIVLLITMLVIFLSVSKPFGGIGIFFGQNMLRPLVFIYVVLLLVSVAIYAYTPTSEVRFEMVEEEPEQQIDLYNLLEESRFDELEDYKLKEWSIPIGDRIHFTVDDDYYGPSIIVKRIQKPGQLRGAFYATDHIINGIDVSEHIKPIEIQQTGNELLLVPPKEYELTFAEEQKEFTITQFTEKQIDHDRMGSSVWYGETILYLEIPEGVEVSSHPNVYIDIEDEEEF
ncbi:hypothetical protein [Bacillus suaedae]|uniref:Uncharacterized protein n=1 Tax=Halalkalibacter suaedae TaxID=2822140 RepID=A0A940WPI2_9BACI|nr:hypothetical protein [Bacillus suaedae]MBP3949966.1 hypothetical protein [Bacillus suaedae]